MFFAYSPERRKVNKPVNGPWMVKFWVMYRHCYPTDFLCRRWRDIFTEACQSKLRMAKPEGELMDKRAWQISGLRKLRTDWFLHIYFWQRVPFEHCLIYSVDFGRLIMSWITNTWARWSENYFVFKQFFMMNDGTWTPPKNQLECLT